MASIKVDKRVLQAGRETAIETTRLSENTPFQVTEAYKTLRTNLLFALAAGKSKAVVISSAMPSEGKSATCANLAIAMSQTGTRVLLIDADLRRPTQYQIFQTDNSKGLTTILAGFNEVRDVIKKKIGENLDLLTSGPAPPNPSELLGSRRMKDLLFMLEDHYDYFFIDTPPINVVTDALVFAGSTAGLLLIARQNQTTYDNLTRAVSSIEFSGVNILGLVINGVNEKVGGYGNYKYNKYAYGKK